MPGDVTTPKAARLARLAELVSVPAWQVVRRGAALPGLPASPERRWIVRGCTAHEDGTRASHAGRSWSSGPRAGSAVPHALERAFRDPGIAECIVQAFRSGPSGVAFVLDANRVLVEYSALHAGVTAGRVRPFRAMQAGAPARYRRLFGELARIRATFGPCDVEFVGIEDPAFVQVRPVTADVPFDAELVGLAMALQELEGGTWVLGSYGIDLMERPERDAALRALLLERIGPVYEALGGPAPRLPERPFLKLGRQTYGDARLGAALRPGARRAFTLGLRRATLLGRARAVLAAEAATAAQLMDTALHLNLLTDVLAPVLPRLRALLLPLREACRERLDRALPAGEAPPDFACSRRLDPRIERDDAAMAWTSLAWLDSPGVVVVPGDLSAGPFVAYARDPERVPADCVLVTDELYPELSGVLARVRGVVCEGGGLGSHLAILAREARLPMVIQATRALERLRRGEPPLEPGGSDR